MINHLFEKYVALDNPFKFGTLDFILHNAKAMIVLSVCMVVVSLPLMIYQIKKEPEEDGSAHGIIGHKIFLLVKRCIT